MNTLQKYRSTFKQCFKSAALATIICGGFAAITVDDAYAQRSKRNKEQQKPIEGRQFSSKTGAIVLKAQEFFAAKQFTPAIAELNKALALPVLNPYERSVINQMLGSGYYELKQISPAISAWEGAISSGGLLPKEAESLRINIAQLLISDGELVRGAEMLENWSRNGGQLKPQHIKLLWQAWLQADQYSRALPWAERWFNNASPKKREHFDVLNKIYNVLQMPGRQADIVIQMINRWPGEKNLWLAWASLLDNGGRSDEAFEVNKMLYISGALSEESEFTKVVSFYGSLQMPYQAAQILEREMNAGRITQSTERVIQLSTLLRQAKEYKKAIPVLEKAIAASGKAKLYADLGEALLHEKQCDRSEKAFLDAMERGFNRGKGWTHIATCRYRTAETLERIRCNMTAKEKAAAPWMIKRMDALEAYDNVPSSSSLGRAANTWKKYIKGEVSRFEDRCEYEKNVVKDQCNIAIDKAYKNVVFAGKFILEDDACLVYKPAYDRKYRKNKN